MYEEECASRDEKEENVPETAGSKSQVGSDWSYTLTYLQRMFCDPRWVLACRL